MIVILGPDGCGKSTIAELLFYQLRKMGVAVRHQHWRPYILPSPRRLAGQQPTSDITRPHDKQDHSLGTSLLLSTYYCLDYWVGYFFQIRPFEKRGGVFIIERYVYDMLFDPHRHRLALPAGWAALLCRCSPRPHLIVALAGDARELYRRKPEIPVSEIERQQQQICSFFRHNPRALFLSTTAATADACVSQIIDYMRDLPLCRRDKCLELV